MRASTLFAICTLFFLTLCVTGVSVAGDAAVSRFPVEAGVDLGTFDISGGLTGDLERTICQ